MTLRNARGPVEILLVEDNPSEAGLIAEALERSSVPGKVHVTRDGEEALAFLRGGGRAAETPRPDIIYLDLRMPKSDGCRVLEVVKQDPDLSLIPVVVFSISREERDVLRTLRSHANCYVEKPDDFVGLADLLNTIQEFWFTVAVLPEQGTV